eukprot:scaffold108997_cov30-Phaeocystis_antarctica.AAC.1
MSSKAVHKPYATRGSNTGLADRVPGRSATHTCAPRLGQDLAARDGIWQERDLRRRDRPHLRYLQL